MIGKATSRASRLTGTPFSSVPCLFPPYCPPPPCHGSIPFTLRVPVAPSVPAQFGFVAYLIGVAATILGLQTFKPAHPLHKVSKFLAPLRAATAQGLRKC